VDVFNRYADLTPKLVTEKSKIKIPVVGKYNDTSTIYSSQLCLTYRSMNYNFAMLMLRFKIHIKPSLPTFIALLIPEYVIFECLTIKNRI